jgi:5'-phosphate synthase pdxT subunit
MTVGVLALQGDFAKHLDAFAELGVEAVAVRRPVELDALCGLVLPGGESTTLSLLLDTSGLTEPLAEHLRAGLAVFGTCAGLVLLAEEILDGRPDQRAFGVLGVTVRRNGYGRQLASFETELDAAALDASLSGDPGGPLPEVFIRAPRIETVGPGVEVLARLVGPGGEDGDVVAVREKNILAAAFHPELTADRRMHRLFLEMAGE